MSEYFGLGSPPPEINKMQAEIERLRGIAFGAEEEARTVRKATIEECARVAESLRSTTKGMVEDIYNDSCERIAAAIRALKEKP